MSYLLADGCPTAVRLLAGMAAGSLRTALDEDLLRIIRAAEAARVGVITADPEIAIMASVRIAPFIGGVGTPGIEALVIGLVGVAPVAAIHVLGQSRAEGAAGDHAPDRCDALAAAARHGIAEQPADQRSGDDTGRIHRLAAILVEGIVIVGVVAGITLLPTLAAVVAVIRAIAVAGATEVPAARIAIAITVAVIGVVIALTVARGVVASAVAVFVAVLESLAILVRRAAVVLAAVWRTAPVRRTAPVWAATVILRVRYRRNRHRCRGNESHCCPLHHLVSPVPLSCGPAHLSVDGAGLHRAVCYDRLI